MANDGRRDPRQPISLEMRFKSATLTDFVEQYSRDISRGGIFIKTASPMPSGTLIKFDIKLEERESLIQGVGRVVWRRLEDAGAEAPAGMGIKFIKLDPTSRENLEAILAGKVDGGGPQGEAPIVAQQDSSEPKAAPQPIAPVRPQAVPKAAKRTMIGMGPQAMQAADSSAPPPAASDEGEEAQETAAGVDDAQPEAAETPEESAGAETDSAVDAPVQEAAADTEEETPAESVPDEEPPAEEKSEPRETDILADISSAIDTALDEADDGDEEPPAPAEGEPAEEGKKEVEAAGEEKKEIDEHEVTQPFEKKKPTEEEKKSEPSSAVVSSRTVAEQERSRFPSLIWLLLIAAGVAGAVWYLKQDPAGTGGPTDAAGAVAPGQKDPSHPSPGVHRIGTEPSALPEKPSAAPEAAPAPSQLATIIVGTKPEGARVVVNGEAQTGMAPMTLDKLAAGKEVEVKAQLFGYVTQSEKVVPGEKPVNIDFALKPAKTVLSFKSEPTGAQVLVDGKYWGKTPVTVTKKKGFGASFNYEIKKTGYDSINGIMAEKDWIEENGVFAASVDVTLSKPAPAPVAEPKPKPEPKPAPKPKAEPKPEPKPKPAPKPKAEPKPEPKPKPAPKPKAEPKPKKEPKKEKPKKEKPKKEEPKKEKPKEKPAPAGGIDENPF